LPGGAAAPACRKDALRFSNGKTAGLGAVTPYGVRIWVLVGLGMGSSYSGDESQVTTVGGLTETAP
jgi:hypothetical protein